MAFYGVTWQKCVLIIVLMDHNVIFEDKTCNIRVEYNIHIYHILIYLYNGYGNTLWKMKKRLTRRRCTRTRPTGGESSRGECLALPYMIYDIMTKFITHLILSISYLYMLSLYLLWFLLFSCIVSFRFAGTVSHVFAQGLPFPSISYPFPNLTFLVSRSSSVPPIQSSVEKKDHSRTVLECRRSFEDEDAVSTISMCLFICVSCFRSWNLSELMRCRDIMRDERCHLWQRYHFELVFFELQQLCHGDTMKNLLPTTGNMNP